jgi:hypothetical protein
MENLPEPIVCEPAPVPRPSLNDWEFIDKGVDMTSEVLSMPWLRRYVDDEVCGVWYWQNLLMRIGSVTGGVLTLEDYHKVQLGVTLHAVYKSHDVPRMFYMQHSCSDICDVCDTYRLNLLMQFGFELSKFLRYDGVDGSVFDDYANDGDNGSVFDDYNDDDDGDYYTNEGNDDGDDGDDDDEVGDDDGYDFFNGW